MSDDAMTTTEDIWFLRRWPDPNPRIRLFCFPFAGGGAAIYRSWPEILPSSIEVCAVQLPGRERRFAEPSVTDMATLVEQVTAAMLPLLDVPFALFGHSMGAATAYEVARRLQATADRRPTRLILAGRAAPTIPRLTAPVHDLADALFMAKLRKLNGTPPQILENAKLMAAMVPMLRADFQLIETYRQLPGPVLDCPMTVLGGEDDTETSPDRLAAWQPLTAGSFEQRLLPGGHFFLQTHADRLLPLVRDWLLGEGG